VSDLICVQTDVFNSFDRVRVIVMTRMSDRRTEVETLYVLETLSPVATPNDDHHVLHKIGRMIPTRGRPLAPRNRHLFPFHPIQRAADVQSPDVVQRL
jgi:hypothetical protein